MKIKISFIIWLFGFQCFNNEIFLYHTHLHVLVKDLEQNDTNLCGVGNQFQRINPWGGGIPLNFKFMFVSFDI